MSLAEVVATGARGATGLNALQLAMGVRARLFEPRACGFKDRRGRAIGLCRVGGLPADLHGYDRLLALAAPALREATAGQPPATVPLLLALPEAGRPDDDDRFDTTFLAELAQRADVTIIRGRSEVVRRGHAGMAWVLDEAVRLLRAGAPTVVVGGVDSYYEPATLQWLDEAYRLHSLEAANGFIPGEAAAFLVLRAAGAKPRAGEAAAPCRLVALARDEEHAVLDDEEPNLARAITKVACEVGAREAPWVLCDVNGERHRLREWRMVAYREDLSAGAQLRLPHEIGDVGAASGAVMMCLATSYWRLGCAPGSRAVILLSSEGTERGALLLEAAS
ncbi:MAG: hypothetical protein JRI68_17730 [Deltaproteobacteria bacterium]|nr:hypothetical protein [Deltaproteobacteria bacterium]